MTRNDVTRNELENYEMKKSISNLIILHFLSWSDKLEFQNYQAGNRKTKLREGEGKREGNREGN
jgi:hypothetical protein